MTLEELRDEALACLRSSDSHTLRAGVTTADVAKMRALQGIGYALLALTQQVKVK